MNSDHKVLAQQLIDFQFGEMFICPMHDQTINNIWEASEEGALLDKILNDPEVPEKAKYIACVTFFKKDIFFLQRHTKETIARIYASALSENYTGKANPWGLLYEHEDEGTEGVAFLVLGETAIESLKPLLEDERINMEYEGSIEATIGNGYRYRVKDFAAHYIGRIRGKPLQYFEGYLQRDQQIELLKMELTGN